MIAIDVGRFVNRDIFEHSVGEMLTHVASANVPIGVQPVSIPGERSAKARTAASSAGVLLSRPEVDRLKALCERLRVPWPPEVTDHRKRLGRL